MPMTETETVLLKKLNAIVTSETYEKELIDILGSGINDNISFTIAQIIQLNQIVFKENIKDLSESLYQSMV